ncbi:MAG: phosphoribosyl-AMP cyclohydrolase [Aestuariivirga sp.]
MDKSELDETLEVVLKFDASGLIPAIVCDHTNNEVLMFAWMNAEALEKTQATGLAHFFSRSRGSLWFKGESSGETFAVNEIRVDCDQDVLQLRVTAQGKGNACHTGRRSCFYRKLENGKLAFIKS